MQSVVLAYLHADPIPLTTLSSRVFAESKLLSRFLSGDVSMTLARADRALLWFSENWPAGAEWPTEVPRPVPIDADSERMRMALDQIADAQSQPHLLRAAQPSPADGAAAGDDAERADSCFAEEGSA